MATSPTAFLGPFAGYRSASRWQVSRWRARAASPAGRARLLALVAVAVFALAAVGSYRTRHPAPAAAPVAVGQLKGGVGR